MSRSTLLACLLLAALCAAAAGADEPTPLSTPNAVLQRLVLDDFEVHGMESPDRYRSIPADRAETPDSRIEIRMDPGTRPGTAGSSLRLHYVLGPQTTEAIGLRILLDDLDASGYDHLAFWVKGDAEDGFSPRFKVGFRRPQPGTRDLIETGSAVVTGVSSEWQQVVVPLNRMSGIAEWTHLSDFFFSFEPRRVTTRRGTYLIDDIELWRTGRPSPRIGDRVVAARKQEWEQTLGGAAAAGARIRASLSGWPSRLLTPQAEMPADDRELLLRMARDTWRGLDALTHRDNGLPIDHLRLATSLDPAQSEIGDYTNVTNIGLHLMAVVSAYELGFIPRPEAVTRLERTLRTLGQMETFAGFFFNYYDTTTLERTSNFLSFVDSSWLTAGLLVARSAFPEVAPACSTLIARGNYGFFYDEVQEQMSHGYYINVPTRSEYHYGALYTEARIGSLIAIGKGDVPPEHWFHLVRTFPPQRSWQTMTPVHRHAKSINGYRLTGGYYRWKGIDFVPSWGGSMFEALMPLLVLDEQRYAPQSLGINDRVHAEVQKRYALEELGYEVWGMSPSATPSGHGYGEYGVKVLGSLGYGAGAVAPYAAALALNVTPEAAVADLRRMLELYDIYGDYGFYDAVNPLTGEVAFEYIALDQSMVLISAANYLRDGCIQKYFAADPIAAAALPLIGEENFFE